MNDRDVLEKAKRGINVVVLAGNNHEVISSNTYDTFASEKNSEQMAADLAAVPVGAVIVAAIKDEGSRKLTQAAKDAFINMGSKEISNLGYRDGWFFMGVKGTKSHLEKRGKDVNGGMILGYSRVTKKTRTKTTKTVTQSKTYKRTINRVVKKKITEVVNGVKRTRVVTRVHKKTVTCHAKRSMKSSKTTSSKTVSK